MKMHNRFHFQMNSNYCFHFQMLPSKKPKLFLNQHDDVMNCYLRSKYFTKTGVGERGVVTGRTLSHRQRQRPRAVTTQAPASVATASCTMSTAHTRGPPGQNPMGYRLQ
uniref:Uncharacterized protein n=1 Tax=Cacopsylla melanoneura TaxID=428564 RepID=A0A8D8VKU2_9HEMI